MPNLNITALSSGGGLTLTQIGTIAAGGDGQTSAGVPNIVPATLVGWGQMSTIADTIAEAQFTDLDMVDVQNAETFIPGAASAIGLYHRWTNVPFISAARQFYMKQNTAGANNLAYQMDIVGRGNSMAPGGRFQANQIIPPSFALAACTAKTWNTGNAFSPSTPLKAGTYALKGARVNALTNYGIIRFSHADFAGCKPGFPVVDTTNTAAARAVDGQSSFFYEQGVQFDYMAGILGQPIVPTFTVTAAGTGLTVEFLDITADTPIVTLYLAKVA